MKLIVKPTSSNLWWGIYGLTEKAGWEDMSIYYENGDQIGSVCLNTKQYLKGEIDDLKKEPEEAEHVKAIENYLADEQIHYWYHYDKKDNKDFFEVPYLAPKNSKGIKPRSVDIWHPHENIGIETIKSAIRAFAKRHLEINDCQVDIGDIETYEASVQSYEEHEKLSGNTNHE